jgi:mRNA-degrading endonuclease YafQ of YafQ-DinJ toxin-antitoxin module
MHSPRSCCSSSGWLLLTVLCSWAPRSRHGLCWPHRMATCPHPKAYPITSSWADIRTAHVHAEVRLVGSCSRSGAAGLHAHGPGCAWPYQTAAPTQPMARPITSSWADICTAHVHAEVLLVGSFWRSGAAGLHAHGPGCAWPCQTAAPTQPMARPTTYSWADIRTAHVRAEVCLVGCCSRSGAAGLLAHGMGWSGSTNWQAPLRR